MEHLSWYNRIKKHALYDRSIDTGHGERKEFIVTEENSGFMFYIATFLENDLLGLKAMSMHETFEDAIDECLLEQGSHK